MTTLGDKRGALPHCIFCDEPVLDDEAATTAGPAHVECCVRSVVGGENHLLGRCSCCGGTEEPDPPGLTRREAARRSYALWKRLSGWAA